MTKRVVLLSLFPGYFASPLATSLLGKAQESGLVDIQLVDIRDYATGPHKTVDDRAFGGGPGMVLMAEPIAQAIRAVTGGLQENSRRRVVYMSPQGAPLTAKRCRDLAAYDELVILCGHYEGIDERIIDTFVDEEVSIGDYVLTNGCLSALVMLDATLRFIPGVVGKEASTEEDSFEQGIFDHPHYTRPQVWEGRAVPSLLLGGDHDEVAKWRRAKALEKTSCVRPDLFLRYRMREKKESVEAEMGENKTRIETLTLPVASLKKTKRFYRDCLRWKPRVESSDQLVFSLGGTQELIFVEEEGLAGQKRGMVFTIPPQAMRLDKGLIAKASGYLMYEGERCEKEKREFEKIWWEDPDGYRWVFSPKEKLDENEESGE